MRGEARQTGAQQLARQHLVAGTGRGDGEVGLDEIRHQLRERALVGAHDDQGALQFLLRGLWLSAFDGDQAFRIRSEGLRHCGALLAGHAVEHALCAVGVAQAPDQGGGVVDGLGRAVIAQFPGLLLATRHVRPILGGAVHRGKAAGKYRRRLQRRLVFLQAGDGAGQIAQRRHGHRFAHVHFQRRHLAAEQVAPAPQPGAAPAHFVPACPGRGFEQMVVGPRRHRRPQREQQADGRQHETADGARRVRRPFPRVVGRHRRDGRPDDPVAGIHAADESQATGRGLARPQFLLGCTRRRRHAVGFAQICGEFVGVEDDIAQALFFQAETCCVQARRIDAAGRALPVSAGGAVDVYRLVSAPLGVCGKV